MDLYMTKLVVHPNQSLRIDITDKDNFEMEIVLHEYSNLVIIAFWDLHVKKIQGALNIIHRGVYSVSSCICKTVLENNSSIDLKGSVIVEKTALGSQANLQFQQLVLDDSCTVKTKPQLWIYQDNAHCKHGSSTTGITSENVFYFNSRGLDKEQARVHIKTAFLKTF